MDPSLALFISIALILLLIRKINVGYAILLGATLLGLLTIGTFTADVLVTTATSFQTLRIMGIVVSAFTLGFSMQELGLLKSLSETVSGIMDRLSLITLPAIVGFLPMPGGALVSAIMLTDLVKKYRASPERATYLNYWFRHLWVPIWPLYPSFIIGAAVVEVSYHRIIEACYPVTIGMILAGLPFIPKVFKFDFKLKDLISIVKSIYPLLIVVFLAIVIRIDLLLTLPLAIALLYVHKRPNRDRIVRILRRTIDPKILVLVFGVMFYKNLICVTHSAQIFFLHLKELRIPTPIASFLLAFVVGFSVGIEISYSAIALPLLTAFTGMGSALIPKNLMLVFGAGLLGVMLSPLHLCLILTSEYYSADMGKVYRYLIPSGIILCFVVWLAYIL